MLISHDCIRTFKCSSVLALGMTTVPRCSPHRSTTCIRVRHHLLWTQSHDAWHSNQLAGEGGVRQFTLHQWYAGRHWMTGSASAVTCAGDFPNFSATSFTVELEKMEGSSFLSNICMDGLWKSRFCRTLCRCVHNPAFDSNGSHAWHTCTGLPVLSRLTRVASMPRQQYPATANAIDCWGWPQLIWIFGTSHQHQLHRAWQQSTLR